MTNLLKHYFWIFLTAKVFFEGCWFTCSSRLIDLSMKNLLLFLVLVINQYSYAQDFVISGKITESNQQALPSASVMLLHPEDSSTLYHTVTNTEGEFRMEDIEKGTYIFRATFLGFLPYHQKISSRPKGGLIDLGAMELHPDVIELEEVTISRPNEVVVKEDTVEYNAGSFTTRPNANVEQLLKRLPGLEVERDGNITVQGERVTRIFVDGKEYYGSNLKMATRNLPADAIEKVQVIDEKSEEARFSGVADGQRQKIINVTLKEERRNSDFGKTTAGAGTSGRYTAQGNYDRLSEKNMISIYGSSNNINNYDVASGGSSSGAGGNRSGAGEGIRQGPAGVTTSLSGGLNFFNQFSEKTHINGNYMLDYSNTHIIRNLTRQNFLPEGTAMYSERNLQRNTNSMHLASVGMERKDSINTFRLNTSFNLMGGLMLETSNRESFSPAGDVVNQGIRTSSADNNNLNMNTDLFYGHRFGKSGRLFTVSGQFSLNKDEALGLSDSNISFDSDMAEDEKQRNEQQSFNRDYALKFAYTEPLGNRQFLQINYNLSNRSARTHIEVFDIISEKSLFNEEQSTRFRTGFLYQQAGISYRLNRSKYNLSVGGNLQQSVLSRRLLENNDLASQNFRNFLPYLSYNRKINRFTRIVFNYSTGVREPSVNQLQPVLSRFDPLNIYVGNPALRPEYAHQGRFNFNTSAGASGVFLSGSLTYNYRTNPIVQAVSIDERQVRTVQYVNVSHSNDFAAFLNMGVTLERLYSRIKMGPYLRQGQSFTLLNGVEGLMNQRSLGGNFSYSFIYKEFIDLNLRSNFARTSTHYEVDESRDQEFFTAAYMADATLHFLKKYNFMADFNFQRFRNAGTGFNQSIPILNLSISRFLLKDNRGEIKFSAVNMLNQNVGASQYATVNYIEQSVQNTLGNYYLISFSLNLDK